MLTRRFVLVAIAVIILSASLPAFAQTEDFAGCIASGKEMMGQHKYEEALSFFKKAVALDPKSAEGYYFEATALYWLERYKEADRSIEEAIKRNNQHYLIWYYRGKISLAMEAPKDALGYFEKSIECNHLYKDSWFEKGMVLYGMKQYGGCIGSMGKVINLDSTDGRAWCIAGMAYFWLGNMDQSKYYITKGLSVTPSYREKIPERILKGVGL